MRAVVQRVKNASVKVDGKVVGEIGKGLLVFLAVHADDSEGSITKMSDKIINLRIFSDSAGKMNLALKDVGGEILVVSQFTLYGNTAKGNRPSFAGSAEPKKAVEFYLQVVEKIKSQGIKVETGKFGAMMDVELTNDGPVTLIIET